MRTPRRRAFLCALPARLPRHAPAGAADSRLGHANSSRSNDRRRQRATACVRSRSTQVGCNDGHSSSPTSSRSSPTRPVASPRQRACSCRRRAHLSAERVVFNTKTGHRHVLRRVGHAVARTARRDRRACSARRSPTSISTARRSRSSGRDRYRITQRRVHDLRAADAALGDRQPARHAEPRGLRDAEQHGPQGEGRAGVLPAGAVLPDPRGRSRDRLPDADLRHVDACAGRSLSNAFFWAINRSQDATLFHDWFSKDRAGCGRRVPLRRARPHRGNVPRYSLRRARATIVNPTADARRCGAAQSYADQRHPDAERCRATCAPARASTTSPTSSTQQRYQQNIYAGHRNRPRTIGGN